ncbi:MAG: cyclic nucleotide-binding domain-containing protein [Endomicrobium sp.]|jgi:CRP-like cAMP-binding protein|nr:cyclic nucleotide-binding domain-containing protein [Endomicrobium sp.]
MIKEIFSFFFIDTVLKKEVSFLKTIPLFHGLSNRSLAKIALVIFKRTYLADEKIYKNNSEENVVYIVKSGQVKLSCGVASKLVELGGFFGETSLIKNNKRTCSAEAIKDSELYLIYCAKLEDMFESNSKVGLIIMKNLASILASRLKCCEIEGA